MPAATALTSSCRDKKRRFRSAQYMVAMAMTELGRSNAALGHNVGLRRVAKSKLCFQDVLWRGARITVFGSGHGGGKRWHFASYGI